MKTGRMERLEIYYSDLRIKNPKIITSPGGGGIKKNIEFFSASSRRRLLFICRNSGHKIKSQILLTYHNVAPLRGDIVKRQLNQLLVELRKKYQGINYIWVLEFHKSGVPHVHLFTDLEYNQDHTQDVGRRWNRITGESEMHLQFHLDERNMRKWDMQSGKYLAKQYLAKANQKDVPERFHNVGRFWGASRSMSPRCDILSIDQTKTQKILDRAAIVAVRYLTKRYEKTLKKYGIKKNYRSGVQSYGLPLMAKNFCKYWDYLICKHIDVNQPGLTSGATA